MKLLINLLLIMAAKYFIHVPICLLHEAQAVEFLGMRWQYTGLWVGLGFRLTAITPLKHPPIFIDGLTRVGVYCSEADFKLFLSIDLPPSPARINRICHESLR